MANNPKKVKDPTEVALSHRVGHQTGFELARGVRAKLSGMRKKSNEGSD